MKPRNKFDLSGIAAKMQSAGVSSDIPQAAMNRWNPAIKAASGDDSSTINILDSIGYDPWTGEGVTAKRISAALRSIGGGPVVVNVNSPGGDMFEGLAIYNLLRSYSGEITVNVIGVAASAASIIAMAGDTVNIGRAAFLMIHNCWVVVMGNKNDLREAADTIEPFDKAMAGVYSDRSGMEADKVATLMDNETWIGGDDAVAQGFADSLLAADAVIEGEASTTNATRTLDVALAKSGMPRSERRRLIGEIKGTQDAAKTGTQDAAAATMALFGALQSFETAGKI